MDGVIRIMRNYLGNLYIPRIYPIDIVEILIMTILLYLCISWLKSTRAYTLIKGLLFLFVFIILANILKMNTILWVMEKIATVAVTAMVVIFQPELRKALEQLGQKNVVSSLLLFDIEKTTDERYADKTISELVRAVYDMSEVKTGALIVLEQDILLTEYINTGIMLDALISSQLLVNIFEHNTPLHDGAIVIRGDHIVSATCYLPLSDNTSIGKHLGTRHRAGLGISEVSDCFTIIVSEETGRVSYAYGGELVTDVAADLLREKLQKLNKNDMEERRGRKIKIWKGWDKSEKNTDK